MKLRLVSAVALAACLSGAWGALAGQEAATTAAVPAVVVRLRVVVEPGIPATLALRNGDMGRLTLPDGSQFGLTPVVAAGGSLLHVFQIAEGRTPGAETLKQLARLPLLPDAPARYPVDAPLFEVTLLSTRPSVTEPRSGAGPMVQSGCTRCCVSCGGVTACACAVQMECGSCCCQDHCTCFDTVGAGGGCAAPAAAGGPATAAGIPGRTAAAYRPNQ